MLRKAKEGHSTATTHCITSHYCSNASPRNAISVGLSPAGLPVVASIGAQYSLPVSWVDGVGQNKGSVWNRAGEAWGLRLEHAVPRYGRCTEVRCNRDFVRCREGRRGEEERCWLSWPIAACFGGWSGVEAEVPAAGRWGEMHMSHLQLVGSTVNSCTVLLYSRIPVSPYCHCPF